MIFIYWPEVLSHLGKKSTQFESARLRLRV